MTRRGSSERSRSSSPRAPVPVRLRAAAALAGVLALGELVAVAMRSDLVPGFRIMMMGVLSLQLVFATRLTRYSAGSVLGLFAFEVMAVVASVGSGGPIVLRGVLAAGAVAVISLMGASLSVFPSPPPPRR